VIGSVMRLSRRKRPLDLVEVLSQVRARTGERPWQAVIVGDGPREAAMTRAIRRAGLDDRVQLTGRLTRPQIMHLLARADLYLAPAYLESFGIAALEARCSGLPVVAMRSGGVGEFVQDGVNGYLVEDDAEMAWRAAQLLADPARLRCLGRLSRNDPPDLDWVTIVELSLDAYRAAGALAPRSGQTHGDRVQGIGRAL
jgi:glycosyltransferase involved in cell wall biosynthesis